jgi:hypothetical protein
MDGLIHRQALIGSSCFKKLWEKNQSRKIFFKTHRYSKSEEANKEGITGREGVRREHLVILS